MRRNPTTCRNRRIAALAGAVALGTCTAPALAAPPASDTVLVQVSGATSTADRAKIARELDGNAVNAIPGGWREYQLDREVTASEARAELKNLKGVRRVVLPSPLTIAAVPNDPLFGPTNGGYQWGLRNTAAWSGGEAGADVAAIDGWTHQTSSTPVVVAVIDTGVQVTHPDLASRVWTNAGEIPGNGIDDDANGYVDDVNGWDFASDDASVYDGTGDRHGTHVAGIIAAERDNGTGIAGVSTNARIMPLKFIDGTQGWNTDAVRAIQYAVANGAKVINASFGGTTYDSLLCSTISWAASRGVTVVVAAGNSGNNLDSASAWPAKCDEPSQLTVGAFTHTGALADFSNHSTNFVDVAAPGEWIVSTVPDGYGYMSGTSMATPFVTGVAAAVLGEQPALTPAQVRARVLNGATPSPELASTIAGGRRLNLVGALTDVPQPLTSPDRTPPAAFGLIGPNDGATVRSPRPVFSWSASADTDSGVAEYRLVVGGQVIASGITGTSAMPASDLPQGPTEWRVDAIDGAGNVRASATRQLTVDSIDPSEPRIVTPGTNQSPVAGRPTQVRWSGDDAGVSQYRVLVNGRVRATVPGRSQSTTVVFVPGRQFLQVTAVDAAGNTASSPRVTLRVLSAAAARRNRARTLRVRKVIRHARIRLQRERARRSSTSRIRVRSRAAVAVSIEVTRRGRPVYRTRARLRRGTTTVELGRPRLASGNYRAVVRVQSVPAAKGVITVR